MSSKYLEPHFGDTVNKIMEDMKNNLPLIRSQPQSRLLHGALEWGEKLGLTPDDKRLIEQYGVAKKGERKPSFVPDKIMLFDGYAVVVQISNDHIGFSHSVKNASYHGDHVSSTANSFCAKDELIRDYIKNIDKLVEKIESQIRRAERETQYIKLWRTPSEPIYEKVIY